MPDVEDDYGAGNDADGGGGDEDGGVGNDDAVLTSQSG